MSVEQYVHGRLRNNMQLGTNGDNTPGIGCIARTDGLKGVDVSELLKRHPQYLSRTAGRNGRYPILYGKELYPSGTMTFVSTMFLPAEDNDRSTWIDHIYLVTDTRDKRLLNPSQWFGLPFIQEDPNQADQAGNARWYELEVMDSFPEGEFRLLPLKLVMEMWKIQEGDFIQLLEAATDSTSFRDRNLVIVYDMDCEDCDQLPYWQDCGEDAERYNHFRMNQLLCWIYHLLPYSFRRTAGYDTMYTAFSESQQIVFVPKDLVGVNSNRQIQLSYNPLDEIAGISTSGAKYANRLLGAGYLFYPGRGFLNRVQRSETELFRREGIIQDFYSSAVHQLILCGEDYCETLNQIEDVYAQIDDHLIASPKGAFCVDIGTLREETFRCRVSALSNQDELIKIADNKLQQKGKLSYDSSAAEEVELFRLLMNNLRSRIDKEHREQWGRLLVSALCHSNFPGQIRYVSDFAKFIDDEELEKGIELFFSSERQLQAVTLTAESGVKDTARNWLILALLKSESPAMKQILARRVGKEKTYRGIFSVYAELCREAADIRDDEARIRYTEASWNAVVPLRCQNTDENVWFVFTGVWDLSGVPNKEEVKAHIVDLGAEIASQAKSLQIYANVVRSGPQAYQNAAQKLKTSTVPAAADLCSDLREKALLDEWLNRSAKEGISQEAFVGVLEIAEAECDAAFHQELLQWLLKSLDKRPDSMHRGVLTAWDQQLRSSRLKRETCYAIRARLADNILSQGQKKQGYNDVDELELFRFVCRLYAEYPDYPESASTLGSCCNKLSQIAATRGSMTYFTQLLQQVQGGSSRELESALLSMLIEPVLKSERFLTDIARQWKNENYTQFHRVMGPWMNSEVVADADSLLWYHSGLSARQWADAIGSSRRDPKAQEQVLIWCRDYCMESGQLCFLAAVVDTLTLADSSERILELLVLPVAEKLVPQLANHAKRSDLKDYDTATARWEKNARVQQMREMLLLDEMIDLKWKDVSNYLTKHEQGWKVVVDAGLMRRNDAKLDGTQRERMAVITKALRDSEKAARWFRMMCQWLPEALEDHFVVEDVLNELCTGVLNYARYDCSADSPFTGSYLSELSRNSGPMSHNYLQHNLKRDCGLGRLARLLLAVEILNGDETGTNFDDLVFRIPKEKEGITDIVCLICYGRMPLRIREQKEAILSILVRCPELTKHILLMSRMEEFSIITRAVADNEAMYHRVKNQLEEIKRENYWAALNTQEAPRERSASLPFLRPKRTRRGSGRRAR